MTAPEIHAQGARRKTLYVWPSQEQPESDAREAICQWLASNGIDPKDVALEPITLEFVPRCAGSITSCRGISHAPWWISYTHRFRNPDGHLEINALAGQPAQFHRTVPLTVEPPLSLVPEWESQEVYQEEDPAPRLARLSQVQAANDDDGDGQ